MATPRKKMDLWPLIVGVIAAVGIIGSDSTGGITKQTRGPDETERWATTAVTTTASTEPDFEVVSFTKSAKLGQQANISIIAEPGVTYDIMLKIGKSAGGVAGMEAKTADSDGRVSWEWRVPMFSEEGKYTLEITGGGKIWQTEFIVN